VLDDAAILNREEVAHCFIRCATASCLWVAVSEFVYHRTELRSELVLSRGVAGVHEASENCDHEPGVACASFTRGVAQLVLEKIAKGEVPCPVLPSVQDSGCREVVLNEARRTTPGYVSDLNW
jgi:hypothetical protein